MLSIFFRNSLGLFDFTNFELKTGEMLSIFSGSFEPIRLCRFVVKTGEMLSNFLLNIFESIQVCQF